MKPHKHAELIKAWADGAVIERMWAVNDEGKGWWLIDNEPDWNEFDEYRIKPEPKPDVVMYALIDIEGMPLMSNQLDSVTLFNVKLTFSGDASTGWELKNVEMLK